MRFFRPFLVLALLVPSLQAFAAGDNLCTKRGLADQLGISAEDITLAEAQNTPIYVSFPQVLAEGDTVTFEILSDGEPVLSQTVELTEGAESNAKALSASSPVVEVLAGNEARLGYVYRLSGRHNVEIRAHLNGVEQETHSFANLVTQSEILPTDAIYPLAHRSTVQNPASIAPPVSKGYSCIEICGLEQDACYDLQCGPFGSSSCYDACDDIFQDCVDDCNGVCTPTTTSNTTYTTVSTTPTQVYECHTSPLPFKGIYRLYTKRIKRTITTTTTNADCTQTVTTQISYFNIPCWIFQYSSPFCFDLGYLNNLC